MSAEQMFYELGFVNNITSYGCVRYKTNIDEDGFYLEISFNIKKRKFRLSKQGSGIARPFYADVDHLKAIQKQYEEFGWLQC